MKKKLFIFIILFPICVCNAQESKHFLSANIGTTATSYNSNIAPFVYVGQKTYGRTLTGGYFMGGYGIKKHIREHLAGNFSANVGLRRFYFVTDTLEDLAVRRTSRLTELDLHVNQFLVNVSFSLSSIIGKHINFNYGIGFNGTVYNNLDNAYSAKGRGFTDYTTNKLNWTRFDAGLLFGVTYSGNKMEGGFQYYIDVTKPAGINSRNSFTFVVPSIYIAYILTK